MISLQSLIDEFKVIYDLGNLALPGFEDEEIVDLLNVNQNKLISQKITGNNAIGQKFPESVKRIDDFKKLMKLSVATLVESSKDNDHVKYLELPTDLLHIYDIQLSDDSNVWHKLEPVKADEAKRFFGGYRNSLPILLTPKYESAFYYDEVSNVKVYWPTDLTLIPKVTNPDPVPNVSLGDPQITYIKKPTDLTSIGEISWGNEILDDFEEDVYHELVQMTKDHAVEIVSPEKAQVSQSQLTKME